MKAQFVDAFHLPNALFVPLINPFNLILIYHYSSTMRNFSYFYVHNNALNYCKNSYYTIENYTVDTLTIFRYWFFKKVRKIWKTGYQLTPTTWTFIIVFLQLSKGYGFRGNVRSSEIYFYFKDHVNCANVNGAKISRIIKIYLLQ